MEHRGSHAPSLVASTDNDAGRPRIVGRRLGRVAAVAAAASGAVHLVMLPGLSLLSALLMGVAAGACLSCAPRLWRGPTSRVWATVALMNVMMLGIHGFAMSAGVDHGHAHAAGMHHSSGGAMPDAPVRGLGAEWIGAQDSLMWSATTLAGLEVALALGVLGCFTVRQSRGSTRRVAISPPVD